RAATALALGLAACSSMEGPNALLPQQEAQSVADVVVADAASLADAASYNAASGVPMASAPANATTAQPCPTISPQPVVNSDGDTPPDSVHFDFTGCIIQQPLETITLSGAIDYVDPTPTTADHSRRVRFTDFTRTVTKLLYSKTTSIELNGVRTFTAFADDNPAAPLQRGLHRGAEVRRRNDQCGRDPEQRDDDHHRPVHGLRPVHGHAQLSARSAPGVSRRGPIPTWNRASRLVR